MMLAAFFKNRIQIVVITTILLFSASGTYALALNFWSHFYYHQAKKHSHTEKFGLAISNLKKAIEFLPNNHHVHKDMAMAYHRLAGLTSDLKKSYALSQKARTHSQRAYAINPIDTDILYTLAVIESRMQKQQLFIHPERKDHNFDPMTRFSKAIELNPNGVRARYDLILYLFEQGMTSEMLYHIEALTRIYPLTYQKLKKEILWSSEVETASINGLIKAAGENIQPRHAHLAVASIMIEKQDWHNALIHYEKALQHDSSKNHATHHLFLGSLHLKNKNHENAEMSYIKAMRMSHDQDQCMDRIYQAYRDEGLLNGFLNIYLKISRTFFITSHMKILESRCLFELNRYEESKKRLIALNQDHPMAEAYYWLAKIAEKEKDWDEMELAAQKASMIEPTSSDYHYIFSVALKRQNKLDQAERTASLAIINSDQPKYGLFIHRANIRWQRKDYQGVINDLNRSITLKPDRADLYARTGETYIKLGQKKSAVKYLKKALDLDPTNLLYKEKYKTGMSM